MKHKLNMVLFALLTVFALSAEELSFDQALTGWQTGFRAQVKFDSEAGAVRLTDQAGQKRASLHRVVELEPNTKYELSFSIRGEKIADGSGQGAKIILNAGQKWSRITTLMGNAPETGTFDWRTGKEVIDTAEFPDAKIRIELNLTGEGTVWFKDLKIEKKASEAPGSLKDALAIDRKLTGWNVSSVKNIAVDDQVKVGAMSVRLRDGGQVWKMLELEPNTQYELTFYVKGEEIESGKNQGARIVLNAGKKWGRITAAPDNKPDTGTFDWKQGSGVIDTARFPDSKIRIELNLTGEGTAWFDDLVIVKKKSSPAAVKENSAASFHRFYGDAVRSAALVPQGVCGFFVPGEPVKVKLLLDGKARDLEAALTVKDDTGKTVFKQEKKPLTGEFELPAQPCGYYAMESDVYADGKKVCTIQGGFAVAPVPGKRDPFFQFGFGALPELHDGYKRIGCGSIALKLDWRSVLQHHNVKRCADYLVNVAYKPFLESGDFQLVADVGTSLPRTLRSKQELEAGYPLMSDDMIKIYSDFIAEIAPRVGIKEWSLGQETPSNATMSAKYVGTWSEAMANFVTLVRIGSRQLKKFDPEIKILAGGNNIPAKTQDIEPIEMGDIVREFDLYYIDAYTGNWDLAKGRATVPEVGLMDFYRAASALSVRLGKGKYIVNNETGYSIPYGAPFDSGMAVELAYLTARSLIISKAAPVLSYQLFRPNEYNRSPGNDDTRHMATVWKTIPVGKDYHRVPLPGGAMYATCAAELAFAKVAGEIINGNVYSYLFTKPDGSTLVTLWNIEEKQPFALELPAGSKVLNMYGRDLTGKPLVIGPEPLYITIAKPAAEVVPLIEQAIYANTPEFKCVALPDAVMVRSLVRATREVEIRMPGQAPLQTKLLPGKTGVFPMQAAAPGKLISGKRTYDIPLEKLPVCTLKKVADPAQLRSGKPGLLHYPDHVRPVEALQPERCYFRTEGFNPNGHNVSAQYWLGYDDKNFYMVVEVDDPVHLQRCTGKDIWHDDSLQFVLSPQDYPPSTLLSDAEPRESSEYNFGLALTPQGVQLVKFLGKDAGVKDYPAKVVRQGNTTVYEVAVPWSAVGGRAKRFGFLVWDNNNPAQAKAPYRLELTPGIAGGADSSRLAKVKYE